MSSLKRAYIRPRPVPSTFRRHPLSGTCHLTNTDLHDNLSPILQYPISSPNSKSEIPPHQGGRPNAGTPDSRTMATPSTVPTHFRLAASSNPAAIPGRVHVVVRSDFPLLSLASTSPSSALLPPFLPPLPLPLPVPFPLPVPYPSPLLTSSYLRFPRNPVSINMDMPQTCVR
jgi:hypothetical protein